MTPAEREAFFAGFVRTGPPTRLLTIDHAKMLELMGADPARWELTSVSEDREKIYFHLRGREKPAAAPKRRRSRT